MIELISTHTAIVIQAHDKSTRLPKKLYKVLGDMTVIEHCICTCCMSNTGKVIVATSRDDANYELINTVKSFFDTYRKLDLYVYEGDDADVLGRYYACAKDSSIDTIVRITSDSPLISKDIINMCIYVHKYAGTDVTDFLEIDGSQVQIISMNALERLNTLAISPEDREHVFTYVYANPDKFSISHLKDFKLSIDTEEDFNNLNSIFFENNSSL